MIEMEKTEQIESFKQYLQKENLSEPTIKAYVCSVKLYYGLHRDITLEALHSYKMYLQKNYRPASVNQKICGINRYLKYLYQPGEAERMPSSTVISSAVMSSAYQLSTVRLQTFLPNERIISNREYKKLKQCLKRDGHVQWYLVVWFLAGTGARISELLKTRVEHLQCGYMDIYTKGGKIRRIYIPEIICREALKWCDQVNRTSGFVFRNSKDRQITDRGIRWKLKKLAKKYGIDEEVVYPHSFRHRFAQNFLQRFHDITLLADLLGHESVETTRIYLIRSVEEQRKAIDEKILW